MLTSFDVARLWPADVNLSTILNAGAVISAIEATEKKAANPDELSDVLRSRLRKFDELLGASETERPKDLGGLKLNTAFASLFVLERVQAVLVSQENAIRERSSSAPPPLLGSRDMTQLRTHIVIVLKWGAESVLAHIAPSLSKKRPTRLPPGAQIIDLTSVTENYTLLDELVRRLLAILFPEGPRGDISQTLVAKTILNGGFTNLLRPSVVTGWLPEQFHADIPPSPDVQVYSLRLLECTPPSQTIASLGQIMSQPALVPAYVGAVCSQLLSSQLLRSAGVAGLFSAMFGEDTTSTEAPLVKLENVSKVLNSVPSSQTHESYYLVIMTRLLHLLTPSMARVTPPAHKRAAAFTLSRMLTRDASDKKDIRMRVIEWSLFDSFRPESNLKHDPSLLSLMATEVEARTRVKSMLTLSPTDAVPTLSTILTNTDPSPELFKLLLQPIIPQLYSLFEYLQSSKIADPVLIETVEGLLNAWASAADKNDAVDVLWSIVQGNGFAWGVDDGGDLTALPRENKPLSLTMTQLADLQEGKLDEGDDGETNALNLYPHPSRFATFLSLIKRDNVSSALYSLILNAHVMLGSKGDPLRKLLLFKLMMRISAQGGDAKSSGAASRNQDVLHQLMFIKLSLDQDSNTTSRNSDRLSLDGIRLAEDSGDVSDGEDNDDNELVPGLDGVDKSEHLVATAINLLLAILEANPGLSPGTEPLLNDIYSQLELIAGSASDVLRPRVREARLMLTARLASASLHKDRKQADVEGEETPQGKYERALKLLQDPLLPVRAHGLLMLRELAAANKLQTRFGKTKERASGPPEPSASAARTLQDAQVADPAISRTLVSDILNVFMHAIQDEDSYIFLNAVQGLAAMVDSFGDEVLQKVVAMYTRDLGRASDVTVHKQMTIQEVDTCVRIGEALEQIIRRCGDILGKYVETLIPPIFALLQRTHLPTTVRTSAVSLLAAAVDTNTLALTGYMDDLLSSMLDLIQVESVAASRVETPAREQLTEITAISDQRADHDVSIVKRDAGLESETILVRGDRQEGRSRKAGAGNKRRVDRQAEDKCPDEHRGEDCDCTEMRATMDAQPTAANAKFPPLRRAALHFVALLLRSLTVGIYGISGTPAASAADRGLGVSALIVKRGITVLGYVASTDADELVRIMAREATEQAEQLRRALVGL